MRKLMLAAVAAVGMGGASEAAVVTYELDYAYDLRKFEFDGYREDDDGTEHHITITTPTKANTPAVKQSISISFDTDLVELSGSTLKGSGGGYNTIYMPGVVDFTFAHDDDTYGSLEIELTFDADQNIDDWLIRFYPEYHGSSGALVWERDSVTDSTSLCCVAEIFNDVGEPGYNPYPDLFPYYYVNQILFDSAPQAWTKTTELAPVPLPAAAPMLLTGAGVLLGLRALRRA